MGSVNLLSTGLDVQSIVDNLITVERAPIQRLQNRAQTYQNTISAYQTLNTKLLALKTSVESLLFNEGDVPLNIPSGFSDRFSTSLFASRKATSSDESVVSATVGKGMTAGNFSITVSQLAKYDTYASNNFASDTALTTKTGTLDIQKQGGTSITVTIDATNNSLQGIKNAINAENAGITATILNDGSGTPYRLVITSDDSGSANALTITNGLTSGTGDDVVFTQTTPPADAQLQINGVNVTSSSNTVANAVEGVTFDLRAESGNAVVRVERDTDAIVTGIKDLVAKYNDVYSYISSQFRYDPTTKKAGILAGDFTLRQTQGDLSSVLTQSIDSGSSMKVLSQAGIKLANDGTLSLDETKLREQLSSNFNQTAQLFLANGLDSLGNSVSFAPMLQSRLKALTDSIDGPVFHATEAIQQNIRRINDQVDQMEERLEARRVLLIRQYTKADEALKNLNVLQTSLTSLMDTLSSL